MREIQVKIACRAVECHTSELISHIYLFMWRKTKQLYTQRIPGESCVGDLACNSWVFGHLCKHTTCATWTRLCAVTYSYVGHGAFMCGVTRLWIIAPWCLDWKTMEKPVKSFGKPTVEHATYVWVAWLIDVCGMNPFVRVMLPIYMCNLTVSWLDTKRYLHTQTAMISFTNTTREKDRLEYTHTHKHKLAWYTYTQITIHKYTNTQQNALTHMRTCQAFECNVPNTWKRLTCHTYTHTHKSVHESNGW